jgi:hypothetical protein
MFGDKQVLPDWVALRMVNIVRPFCRIRVRAGTQPGEQGELKVIVRIDQARQDLKAVEIQIDALDIHGRRHLYTKPAGDKDSRFAARFGKAVKLPRALKDFALRRPEARLD